MDNKDERLRLKHERIKNYLKSEYAHVITKYGNLTVPDSHSFIEKTSPVWVCWWQGEAYMPRIVRVCYESIRRHSGTHPVILVTKDNYTEYINIPDFIIEKVTSGAISITHLSDILRARLLYEYGGYWIDSTILLTKTLYEEKDIEFFTERTTPDITYVAFGKWTLFLVGGGRHCLFFDFAKTFLEEYWKKEDTLIDYFIIDYIADVAYDEIPVIRKMVDGNDCFMPHIFDLSFLLNQPFDADKFNDTCKKANFHKLSWKYPYTVETGNKEQTFYGYLDSENKKLKDSEMERAISYYRQGRETGNNTCIEKAEKLMKQILHDIENGAYMDDCIYRAGCGIIYLLRNDFVEGNEDEVLYGMDEMAFRDVYYRAKNRKSDLYLLLRYLKLRISGNPALKDNLTLLKNQQLLCETLDIIGRENQGGSISDKQMVSEMEDLYRSGFAKGFVRHILDGGHRKTFIIKQINENNVTFIIPIRIDCSERKRNLQLVLEQLRQIPDASIIILEADSQPRLEYDKNKHVSCYFIEDHDPVYYRTKYINMLLSRVKTKIAGIWDTDVIMSCKQIINSISDIQDGCMMSFPYDGRCFTLPPETSEQYHHDRSMSFLMNKIDSFPQTFGTYSIGGAFMINREAYLKVGGENEHFYGWGVEDLERVKRVEILGYPVSRVEGPLFHLYHPRTSWYDSKETEISNRSEYVKICNMTGRELEDYIKTWRISKYAET